MKVMKMLKYSVWIIMKVMKMLKFSVWIIMKVMKMGIKTTAYPYMVFIWQYFVTFIALRT